MLNHLVIMGRLVSSPELKQTPSGVDLCNFTIACDRDFKNGDEKVADFLDVTAWRHTAKFIANNFGKGRMIVVSGRLQTRKYQDKNGNNRVATEIQAENVYFADSKKSDTSAAQTPQDFPELPDEGDVPF
jgi:single-strand DNA-binding protein